MRENEQELRQRIGDLAYDVTQNAATEHPFTGQYDEFFEKGIYVDVVSGEPLLSSKDKYNSGCSWPAFTKPLAQDSVTTKADFSHFMRRTEVNKIKADLTWRYPFIKMDEVYAHKDGMDLHVHVIMPTPTNLFPSEKTFPLVVYVQGSAFQKQNMGDHLAHLAEFAMRGYVIAMVEYRYAPKATFPKQILDVKTAIRFLYQNKEKYHIQADQAILWGDSSDGHTVVMTAVTEHNQNFSEEDNETQPLNIIGVMSTPVKKYIFKPVLT